MHNDAHATYPPLNTLNPVAEYLWMADGPVIEFGFPWPKLPFPTRMTVIRLASGGLFVRSPTPLTPDLRTEIEQLGPVRFIVGPNRIHYWWTPDWAVVFPDASVYLASRIKEQAKGRIDFLPIERDSGYPWDAEIATLLIVGGFMTDVEFFHHASRTLILTDLIENFEREKIDGWFL